MRSLIALLITAILALAAARTPRDVAWADTLDTQPVRGVTVDAGAPLWPHDPTSLWCLAGCAQVGRLNAVGQPVGIICRSSTGYLKVAYASGRVPAWVFAADVHAAAPVTDCGGWDT